MRLKSISFQFIFITLMLIVISLFQDAHSQKMGNFKLTHMYIFRSTSDIKEVKIKSILTFGTHAASIKTTGEKKNQFSNSTCIFKGSPNKEKEGRLKRTIYRCLSGGKVIYTSRPGQKKVAFVNMEGDDGDYFDSGIVYTNFSTDSISELLFW